MALRTTQYVRQEKAIAAADRGGIWQRWMSGLRMLNDPDVMTESRKSLRHGVAVQLVAAATAGGLKLSAREIQWRLQCARAYPTETQMRNAVSDFETWHDLVAAGFPAYDAPEGEPPADWRTELEQDRDRRRALLDLVGDQGTLFPLSDFEPVTTTLKELVDYTQQMEELTARFAKRDRERRAYLDGLVEAARNDLSMRWQEAHDRAYGGDPSQGSPTS